MARPLRAVVVVALGLLLAPVARAAVIDADPDARRVQAAGTDLTWLSAPRVGDGDFAVTLRVRHGGRNVSAPGVPGRYSASAPEAYGDLGMDRSGRVVQVVGDSLGFLSFTGETMLQGNFWAFAVRTRQAVPLALPGLGPQCVVVRMAVWREHTAAAANCGGLGAIFVDDDRHLTRPLTIPGLDRYAETTVELDATAGGIGVVVAFTDCDAPAPPGEACGLTLGGADRHMAWLLRDGCPPLLVARTRGRTRMLDAPQLGKGGVFWLASRDGVAVLRRRTLGGRHRCHAGRAVVARRIGRWHQHVSVAVSKLGVFVARDRAGIRRLSP